MNVFTPEEARKKRGATADEMLCCPKCGEHQGVHIYTPMRVDKSSVDSVHVELWNCLSCRHRWWEEFVVKFSTNGATKNLFDRIMKAGSE